MADIDVVHELIKRICALEHPVTKNMRHLIKRRLFYPIVKNVDYTIHSITYDDLNSYAEEPRNLTRVIFRNDSDGQDTQTWKTSQTTTDSATYTFQWGLKLGVKTTFKTGIPILAVSDNK